MQNFHSPRVNSDILASNDEGIQDQKGRELVNLFLEKQVHDIEGEVEENAASDELSWDDPRLPLSNILKIVELNQRGPKHLEGVRHGAEQDHSNFFVGQVLLE